MDTETTGLAGGTGTLVFLLGMARFSDGVLEIAQLFLTGFQGEGGMLEEARDFLRGADTLVTRTVELAASALRATLQPGPEAGVESEDRPQAPVAPEVESEVVVEVEIAADRAAPFVEVMPEGEPPAPVAAEAPEAPEPSRVTLERIDPNTSAALVRRMLAVYERMRNGG